MEGDVFIDKLADFKEAGACGTAAVITPIGGISYNDHLHVFHSETEVPDHPEALQRADRCPDRRHRSARRLDRQGLIPRSRH